MKIGANQMHRAELEAALGRKYDYLRIYNVKDAQTLPGPGVAPVVSTKPGKWADVAAGKADAQVKADAQALAALTPGCYIMHHEPENDTASFGTSAQFVAAFDHVVSIMRPLMPGWDFCVCLIGETFGKVLKDGTIGGFANGGPAAWTPASADIISIDKYDWCGARKDPIGYAKPGEVPVPADQFYAPFLAHGTATGKRLWVTEYGACRVDGEDGSIQAPKIERLLPVVEGKVEAFLYFNSDAGDPGCITNNRIDQLAPSVVAFKKFGTPVVVDPCADVQAELDATKVELSNQEIANDELVAANDALVVQLNDAQNKLAQINALSA
jgi:hypothetical protein